MKKESEFDDDDDEEGAYIDDENIYAQKTREMLVDEDCLTAEEEGFMQGYEEAGAI